MEKVLDVIYNGSCPVCSSEVNVYRKHAEAQALPIRFNDLNKADLDRLGLTPEQAAKRFHVFHDGQMLSGVPAFLVLWRTIPRYRWIARIVGLPGIRHLAVLAYDHIAAPILYGMHKRRVARQCTAPSGDGGQDATEAAPRRKEHERA